MPETISHFLTWIEETSVGTQIRESAWLFPSIETVHVISIVIFVGLIFKWDFKLMNITSRARSVIDVHREIIPRARLAFIAAVLSGGLLFTSNATGYAANTAFRLKMLLLLLGGLNMAFYEIWLSRHAAQWDRQRKLPFTAKLAGVASFLVWLLVVAFGRWIGFTM